MAVEAQVLVDAEVKAADFVAVEAIVQIAVAADTTMGVVVLEALA